MPIRARWITSPCLVALLLAGCDREEHPASATQAGAGARLADETRPNVLLISIDSLRPDHLHCYGYPKQTSPRIDQLAREGALFENAISSTSWTLPAHGCMFTGLVDSVHGCLDTDRRLHDEYYTLAERLRDAGYVTAGFFSGPYLHPIFGLDQGFGTYVDCTSYAQLSDQTIASKGTVEGRRIQWAAHHDITNPKVLAEVRRWLAGNTQVPFFMFVHMWDVHYDYIPPPPYNSKFDPDYTGEMTGERFFFNQDINKGMPRRDLEHLLGLYDGEIAWTDEHVGKILDQFRARELLDSTLIILTSDHGTAFFEHENKGHRNALFDELIRIPLIIRYPARIAAGQRYREQVRMIDLLPTTLDLLGLPAPDLMGQTLVPLFAGGVLARDEPAISELFSMEHALRSFRLPERKTIIDLNANSGQIYDLRADPQELSPLRDRDSPVAVATKQDVQRSLELLQTYRQRFPQSPRITNLPDDVFRKLQSLGYVGEDDSEEPKP